MLTGLILYIIVGCSHCQVAEQALHANCIAYTTSTGYEPNGINMAPVLEGKGVLKVGDDEIVAFANSHNQCSK